MSAPASGNVPPDQARRTPRGRAARGDDASGASSKVDADASAPPRQEEFNRGPHEITFMWRIGWLVCHPLMALMFDLKVYGRRHVPDRGGVLLVSNHQSYLDPVLLGVYLRRPLSYLAKSELFRNKYFAWLIRSLNAFPVKQGAGDVGAVKEMIKRLREGHLLNIYPEGSRTVDGEIRPLEPGAAIVVKRAGVPIVPAIIDGSYDAWPKGQKLPRAHPIRVMYGPPMKLDGLKASEITQVIDQTLRRMHAELRAKRAAELSWYER